ncbi:MAG: RidA family protein [Rhizobiaceae bacterium]
MTSGTIEDQTRSVIEEIREALALAGATLDDVVKSTVYLKTGKAFPVSTQSMRIISLRSRLLARQSSPISRSGHTGRARRRRLPSRITNT